MSKEQYMCVNSDKAIVTYGKIHDIISDAIEDGKLKDALEPKQYKQLVKLLEEASRWWL